jgi:two-component system, sensor histidine kinase ChiS
MLQQKSYMRRAIGRRMFTAISIIKQKRISFSHSLMSVKFGPLSCYLIVAGILLFTLTCCNTNTHSDNLFASTDTIKPPVIIKAGKPEIHILSNYTPPETIDVSLKPHPARTPADFFVTMPNFNTEHGLALSSVLSAFKDKAGNLWFGTFGNGVSKYDGKTFTNYNSSHGLIHNLIEAITEDREGNIWFSTYGGVSKYNGVYFENFTTEHGLPDNHINKIIEDKKGNIWAATRGGLCRYNPDDNENGMGRFIHYVDTQGITGNYAGGIIEDRNNNLWMAGHRGVFKLNPAAGTHGETSFYDYSVITSLEDEIVYSIAEDRDGKIWFATSKGAVRFDPTNVQLGRSAVTTFTKADGLISNSISSILEDRNGNIWFGSEEGVSEFIKDNSSFINYTSEQGLVSNDVVCIVEDQAGSIWFGTKGHGLSKLNGRSTIEYTAMQGLPGKAVFSATEDHKGDIWIGTEDGGLTKFTKDWENNKKGYFTNYSSVQGLMIRSIMTMIVDKAGDLWFGSAFGLSRYDGRSVTTWNKIQGLITNSVISLKEDNKGNIWFGTYEGGLSRFDGQSFSNYTTEQGLVHNTVWNIQEDNTGAIWFATRGGLSRFDGENFINFTTSQGLPDNKLSIVTEDKMGNLLIGSWGGGVSIIRNEWIKMLSQGNASQIKQTIFENYNTSHGLPNDIIYEIIEGEDGNIIIGTSNGFTVLKGGLHANHQQIAKEGVEHFNQQTGYPIKDISNNYSMLVDRDGFIWAGTGDKLVRFDYNEVRKNTVAPQVTIQSVSINHENISWHSLQRARARQGDELQSPQIVPAFVHNELSVFGKRLTESELDTMIHKFSNVRFDRISPFNAIPQNLVLPYTHNTIGFDFVGIETARPFMVQYQFMLDGSEKQWSPPGTRTSAEYSNLGQGTYTFKVRAQSPDGVWSEPISYSFKVLAPWWFTWWAFALYLMLFSFAILGIRRYEMNRILLRNQLKIEKVTTDSLRNLDQLKSHFFANISHEFRTPLTLILGQTESVINSGIDAREKRKLQVAIRNAKKLLSLINELLDLSKLESGSMVLAARRQNIVSFIKSLFYAFESLASDKNIELVFESELDHIPVSFDPDKMEKIFYNLVSNALKFTPKGGKITVSLDIEQYNQVIIRVKDTGTGIPEDRIEHIFDRFYQVDGSNTRAHEGTGIGLALTKELVELHNGRIMASSKENFGSEFVITLPLDTNESGIIESLENRGNGHLLEELGSASEFTEDYGEQGSMVIDEKESRELVLLVEDNPDVRSYIREQLEEIYRVAEADNGVEGIKIAQEIIPDLIISDVMMPKMDGYQFCKSIRADEKTSHIPLIMLTARAGIEHKIDSLETGADTFLTKPFNARELKASIKNLIQQRIQLRKHYSTSTVIRPSEISSVSVDQAFLEKIVKTIETHFEDEYFSVESLADHVNMSLSQLNRKLKALIGQPPGQLISSLRLHRAADLLAQKAGSVSEICYKVGFNDNSYFSRAFKKQFGCSPSEYTNQKSEVYK